MGVGQEDTSQKLHFVAFSKLDFNLKYALKIKLQREKSTGLLDHQKSKRVPEKTSISALLTMPKPLTVWITINCGRS